MVQQERTTIGLKSTTKKKLDDNRAIGQCYDGFLCQLLDWWNNRTGKESLFPKADEGGEI